MRAFSDYVNLHPPLGRVMPNIKALLLLLVLLVLSTTAGTVKSSQRIYIIKGRVVDDKGHPVPNAIIVLQPISEGETIDRIIEYHKADTAGKFCIRETSDALITELTLYITAPEPPNAEVPIKPPFSGLHELGPSFSGQKIAVRENQVVNLQDVPLQVRYGMVLLHIQNKGKDRLAKKVIKDSSALEMKLRVRDSKGDLLSEESISKKSFGLNNTVLAIALPEGEWRLELADENSPIRWRGLSDAVVIRDSTGYVDVTLSVSAGKRSLDTSRTFENYTIELARSKLEQMGIEFNINTFLDRVKKDNINLVKLFLAAGMDVNARGGYGETALMLAASYEFYDMAEALLKSGANVNSKDAQNATALMRAAGNYDRTIVKILLDKGAEVDVKTRDGMTALMIGTANGQFENVKLLLSAGADPNIKNKSGDTALVFATKLGHLRIVELLKRYGARE